MTGVWDRTADVLVVGSGMAGLAAAITAADGGCRVELLEKSDRIGGTTAVSGGALWVPRNGHMDELDVEDSREEARAYVEGTTAGRALDDELIDLYLDRAPEALAWLEQNTPLRFAASPYFSDYYHREQPGSKPGARTVMPLPFESRRQLGDWDAKVRDSPHFPRFTIDELVASSDGGATGSVGLADEIVALMEEREREGIRTNGEALVAALLTAALDRGVTVRTEARVDRLVVGEEGAVYGLVVEEDGTPARIGACRGVVLATGGFEWNPELVRAFLGVPELRPASPPLALGEGLTMGMEVGAEVGNMAVAWTFPTTYDGKATYDGAPLYQQVSPRHEPGCIVVNRRGRRFTNEGVCYMDFGKPHKDFDAVRQAFPNESPVWAVFDRSVRDRFAFLDLQPDQPSPDWVLEAESLAALAEKAGIDAAGLEDEVERFNGFVDAMDDPDFHRGTVWFEGFTGGGPTPEKTLAKLERGPYYAIAIYDGALGTAGGLRIDADARVRSMRGGVIDGLYAAGNAAASIFGPMYPSGGVTLGPAMMFGYLAGRHLAAHSRAIQDTGAVV